MGWWKGEEEDQIEDPKQCDCEQCGEATDVLDKWKHIPIHTVSYTHLTLPTKRIV